MKRPVAASSSMPKKEAPAPRLKRYRRIFQQDLPHIMYGFGDNRHPLPETITLVEDIVVDYINVLVHKAQVVASQRGHLLAKDFIFLMRNDLPKYQRCAELLRLEKEIKKERRLFVD